MKRSKDNQEREEGWEAKTITSVRRQYAN